MGIISDQKQCTKCGEIKPLSEFRKRPERGTIRNQCLTCLRPPRKTPPKPEAPEGMKYCTKCQQMRPLDDFQYAPRNRDKKDSHCTPCRRERQRAFIKNNPDHVKARRERWIDANRDKVREINRRAYHSTKHLYKDRFLINSRLRYAREVKAEGQHTPEEWRAMVDWFGGTCLCCGGPGPLTADHVIPLTKSGSNWIDNIQPLCQACNSSKGNRHQADYRNPVVLAAFLAHLRGE